MLLTPGRPDTRARTPPRRSWPPPRCWRPPRHWMPPRRTSGAAPYVAPRRTDVGSDRGRPPTAGWSAQQGDRMRRRRRLHASRSRGWRRPPARPAGSGRIPHATRRSRQRRSTRDHDRRRPPALPTLRDGTCGISKSARWRWAPRNALAPPDVPRARPALADDPWTHRRRHSLTRRRRPPLPRSYRRADCGKRAAPSSRWRSSKAGATRTPPGARLPARPRRPTKDRPTTARPWRLAGATACGRGTTGPAQPMLLLQLLLARRW